MLEANNKKLVLFLILLLAVVAGSYYIFYVRTSPQIDIRKFSGGVVSTEGNTIKLKGVFNGPQGTIPEYLSSERDFSFQVNENTQYEKEEIDWPTWDEVEVAGGSLRFSTKDLSQSSKTGSLDDLKNTSLSNPGTMYVEANFISSIHRSENPIAASVFYKAMTMPSGGSPTQTP